MTEIQETGQDTLAMDGAKWYALYTRSRHEKVVDGELHGRGVESYLPLHRVLSQWKDRRQWVTKPLFPSYLFARLPQQDLWWVRDVRGVVCAVGNEDGPTPVAAEQVESVRRMLEECEVADPWPYMQEGTRVRVVSGPLIGMEGFIVERRKQCRLVVSVDLLGRSVATEIEAGSVELVR
jgi:transcriptional antiterminator NusG